MRQIRLLNRHIHAPWRWRFKIISPNAIRQGCFNYWSPPGNPDNARTEKSGFIFLFLKIFLFSILVLAVNNSSAATISSTAAGGDWNSASTWVGGVIPGSGDNVIIVSTATVSLLGGSPTNQTGGATLTINGILSLGTSGNPYKNSNYSLGGFSAVVLSGTGSQIYWNGNNTLSFNAGTTFSINSTSSGCQPVGGSASAALVIGSATIAVSSTNANNAAYSFTDFNSQGGLPTFTISVSPSSPACGSVPITVAVTPSSAGVNPFTYTFSISPTSPALTTNFSSNPTTTSGATTTQFTPSNNTVTYTITCNITATGDPLATKTLSYTVNAGPIVSAGSAVSAICQAATTSALGGSFGGGATSAVWSDGGAGGTFTNNTGSTPNTTTYTASSSAPSIVTLTLTTAGGTCNTYASKTVTVNPLPAAAGSITGTATVCQGQNGVSYSVPAISNATGYVWSLPTGATIASGNNTASITVNYSGTATSGNITVYGTNACGNGTVSSGYAVTVNPLPAAAGAITGTATVCQGQNGVSYSVGAITNATGYVWSLPTGASIASGNNTRTITVNYSGTATSGNVTVYGTNACGNGTVSSGYAVTVNPLPAGAGAITGTATVCQGQNGVSYSVGAITNATGYSWSLPTGASIASGNNTRTITVNYSGTATSGNITVYGTNACGNGTVSSGYAVTVNPLPAAAGSITGTATVCQGQNGVSYSVPPITNATGYVWSLPTGATIASGNNTASITVNYSGTATSGNVTVYGTNACGNGTVSSGYAVTVNPLPAGAGAITGTATVCQGQNGVSYSVGAITNATGYSWSLPTGASISSGNNTRTITVNYSGTATSGNITVYGTNACGNGTVSSGYAVTVNPLPAAAGSITGTATVCQGQNGISYSVTPITNATGYVWSLPTGASIATGNNTASITVNYSGTATSGNITVYGTDACGSGTVSPGYTVSVNPSTPGTAYWTGTISTDWCNAGNWSCGVLPDANTNAVILATAPNFPTVNCANESVKDLDLQGSSTFTLPANKSFDITGDIINPNPAQYSLLGTVNFAGANQTIPAFTFNGLTISGSGSITKTLAGPVTVNGTLTLTNGILVTSNTNMLTVTAAGNITGYSNNSYIQGPLTRQTNSGGSYDFPIGNGLLRIVTIIPASSSSGSYSVKYNASAPAITSLLGNLGGVQVNEYWDINRSSGPDVVVSLNYVNPNSGAAWSSGINPCNSCNVAVVQGIVFSGNTNWNFTGTAGGFAPTEATYWQSNGTVFSRQVSSFGQFGFGYALAVILPVTLEYFNGGLMGNNAQLNWKFTNVSGLSETVLEQSNDGIHFAKLASFVKDQDAYHYDAGYLSAATHYYRLKMISTDGTISYSKIVSLVPGPGISYFHGIRPTVVTGDVYIALHSAANQKMQVSIFDVNGRLSYSGKKELAAGENQYRFFAGGLNKGWYYVRLTLEDGSYAGYRFVRE